MMCDEIWDKLWCILRRSHDYLKRILEAKQIGYDYAFLLDSQMIHRDPFLVLGAASI
jgi:hypothetical protein